MKKYFVTIGVLYLFLLPASLLAAQEKEKVVISIVNFGRGNPFEPYKAARKLGKDNINLGDIPFPPSPGQEMGEEYKLLTKSRVNGILYDPMAKSAAIVNIKGTDYMVHKNDIVQGILVADIKENSITLKYGSNTYTLGIGEIVEGEIASDPVNRNGKNFDGLPLPPLDPKRPSL